MDSIYFESLCGRRRNVTYVRYIHIHTYIVYVPGLVVITTRYS